MYVGGNLRCLREYEEWVWLGIEMQMQNKEVWNNVPQGAFVWKEYFLERNPISRTAPCNVKLMQNRMNPKFLINTLDPKRTILAAVSVRYFPEQ
jgi:hypothetical protein